MFWRASSSSDSPSPLWANRAGASIHNRYTPVASCFKNVLIPLFHDSSNIAESFVTHFILITCFPAAEKLLEVIERQEEQGVDYRTIHLRRNETFLERDRVRLTLNSRRRVGGKLPGQGCRPSRCTAEVFICDVGRSGRLYVRYPDLSAEESSAFDTLREGLYYALPSTLFEDSEQ